MAEAEQPLELKKRARRRLVGAVAIAIIAAIVLPAVMDKEPEHDRGQDIQVVVPNPAARGDMQPPAVAERNNESTVAGVADSAASIQIPPSAVPEQNASTVTSISPAPVQNAAVENNASHPVPESATETAAAVQRTPVVSGNEKKQQEADYVMSLLNDTPPSDPAKPYYVQAGAFGDANKAASLRLDLKQRGFHAFLEQAGAVTRVRVGPFASREQAEEVLKQLEGLGVKGMVASR